MNNPFSKENILRALKESSDAQMKVFNKNWYSRLIMNIAHKLGKNRSKNKMEFRDTGNGVMVLFTANGITNSYSFKHSSTPYELKDLYEFIGNNLELMGVEVINKL